MRSAFMPIKLTGSALVVNSISISTASETINFTVSALGRFFSFENNKHAKSQWSPSSRLINSFENVNPGILERFLSQKMDANDPEKKIPSTAAKATSRSPKVDRSSEIQRMAQSALSFTHGTRGGTRHQFTESKKHKYEKTQMRRRTNESRKGIA